MPKMLSDGLRKVVYVPTIANVAAPTTTELNAAGALDLSCIVTAADFSLGATGEDAIDDPALCAVAKDQAPGRITYEAAMTFFRYTTNAEDKAWNLFTAKGMGGFLVQRIGAAVGTAFASGDKVQVYEVITGQPRILSPNGGFEKFMLAFYIQSSNVNERATVASGS